MEVEVEGNIRSNVNVVLDRSCDEDKGYTPVPNLSSTMKMTWQNIPNFPTPYISNGATCNECRNGDVLYIGGRSQVSRGLYLDVKCFSFQTFTFCPHFMETNKVINRYGHSSLSFKNRVFCFGGMSTQTGVFRLSAFSSIVATLYLIHNRYFHSEPVYLSPLH